MIFIPYIAGPTLCINATGGKCACQWDLRPVGPGGRRLPPPTVGLKCGGPRLVVTEVVGLTVGSDTDVDRILVGI